MLFYFSLDFSEKKIALQQKAIDRKAPFLV